MNSIDEISAAMTEIAAKRYGDGAVSQLQHALQCASLAEAADATAELITAALLHDIGHVVDSRYEGAASAGIDRYHEQIGAAYLGRWFGLAVTEPIAMHVAAKRYLCAVNSDYLNGLSAGSIRSLELQGGLLDAPEATEFLKKPYAKDAIRLRRWDDLAKDPEASTASLEHFLCYAAVALERTQAA